MGAHQTEQNGHIATMKTNDFLSNLSRSLGRDETPTPTPDALNPLDLEAAMYGNGISLESMAMDDDEVHNEEPTQ